MTRLSDTQRVILSAASQRRNLRVLPVPTTIKAKGAAVAKVVASLLHKRMVKEITAKRGDPVWRDAADGRRTTLVITAAGRAAIGIAPEHDSVAPRFAAGAKTHAPRGGTKQAKMIAMLRAAEGATIEEIAVVTGWQAHTVRGAMSGALKKKLGLEITSKKVEGRGRAYAIRN